MGLPGSDHGACDPSWRMHGAIRAKVGLRCNRIAPASTLATTSRGYLLKQVVVGRRGATSWKSTSACGSQKASRSNKPRSSPDTTMRINHWPQIFPEAPGERFVNFK